jgi:hypothetical protein
MRNMMRNGGLNVCAHGRILLESMELQLLWLLEFKMKIQDS